MIGWLLQLVPLTVFSIFPTPPLKKPVAQATVAVTACTSVTTELIVLLASSHVVPPLVVFCMYPPLPTIHAVLASAAETEFNSV